MSVVRFVAFDSYVVCMYIYIYIYMHIYIYIYIYVSGRRCVHG